MELTNRGIFDIYSPVTVNVNTLEREIRKKAGKQGGHIVLNLQRTALSVAELNELQRTLRRRQNRHLREVGILKLCQRICRWGKGL